MARVFISSIVVWLPTFGTLLKNNRSLLAFFVLLRESGSSFPYLALSFSSSVLMSSMRTRSGESPASLPEFRSFSRFSWTESSRVWIKRKNVVDNDTMATSSLHLQIKYFTFQQIPVPFRAKNTLFRSPLPHDVPHYPPVFIIQESWMSIECTFMLTFYQSITEEHVSASWTHMENNLFDSQVRHTLPEISRQTPPDSGHW